jgi:hypothetical protein
MKCRIPLALLVLSLVLAPTTHAAALRGTVVAPGGGAASAGWRVVAHPVNGDPAHATATDSEGRFVFESRLEGRVAVLVLSPVVAEDAAGPAADLPASIAAGRPAGGRLVDLAPERETVIVLPLTPNETAAPTFDFKLYKREWWNDKPTEEAADILMLDDEGAGANINFELAEGGGTISGRVTRESGGEPLPGLIVVAFGSEAGIFSFDRTDAQGFYRVTGIPADDYYVGVNLGFVGPDDDYVGEFYDNVPSTGTATEITVTEGMDTPGINFALALGGSISGRVTRDAGGTGVAFALVSATSLNTSQVLIALTDEDGDFAIRRMTVGNWKVGVGGTENLVGEYWNDQATFESATPIAVTAGGTVTNINMAMAAGGVISGVVLNQANLQPVANALVIAERPSDLYSATALTDETGSYEIMALPPGDFRVHVPEIAQWYNNKSSAETADLLAVAGGTVHENINFSGFPLFESCTSPPEDVAIVSGTVRDHNGEPIAFAEVGLYIDFFGTPLQTRTEETDQSGNYSMECVNPGTYLVRAVVPFSSYLAEWHNNMPTTTGATMVTLSAGQNLSGLNFMLDQGAVVSGTVTIAGGGGLQFAEVIVESQTGTNGGSELTNANGQYAMLGGSEGGFYDGPYTVWVADFTTADLSLVPVVLSRFEALATPDGVALSWTTASEDRHAGFIVERAAAPDAARERISDRLITGGPSYRWVDPAPVASGGWYWLVAVDRSGREERFGPITVSAAPVAVTRLLGPAATPSRESAVVNFTLAERGRVALRLFDASGRWVRTLIDDVRDAGAGAVAWDGRAADGHPVANGVYFLRFETNAGVERGRILFVR